MMSSIQAARLKDAAVKATVAEGNVAQLAAYRRCESREEAYSVTLRDLMIQMVGAIESGHAERHLPTPGWVNRTETAQKCFFEWLDVSSNDMTPALMRVLSLACRSVDTELRMEAHALVATVAAQYAAFHADRGL